jgi:hypothetical protein
MDKSYIYLFFIPSCCSLPREFRVYLSHAHARNRDMTLNLWLNFHYAPT